MDDKTQLEEEISLMDLYDVLVRRKKLILVVIVLAILLSGGGVMVMRNIGPAVYEAVATVMVSPISPPPLKGETAYSVLLDYLSQYPQLTVDTYISRVKGQLYQEVDGGKLSNLFAAKILNKTNKEIPVELKVEGLSGEIKLVGGQQFLLKKEAINDYNFFVEIPKSEIRERSNNITIGVYSEGQKIQSVKTKFLGPFK